MKISLLASGSKGNSIVVVGKKSAIMIDAGLSGKKIYERLEMVGVDQNIIKAILVTHEHSDHVRGAGIISRKLKIPLYINELTYTETQIRGDRLGKIDDLQFFENGVPFELDDFLIHPFSVPHDSVNNSCFRISEKKLDKDLIILTDIGYPTKLVKNKIKNPSTIVLESNHDIDKLLNGPYEWYLKQRIKGKNGHLSNVQAGELMLEIFHPRLKNIILAHLSEENNEPEIAFASMKKLIIENKINCNLYVAMQDSPTELIEV
jgi:phosphoribosyl 1,2-cyclic phosphodiesterase